MQTLDRITLIRGSGKWAEVDTFKTSGVGVWCQSDMSEVPQKANGHVAAVCDGIDLSHTKTLTPWNSLWGPKEMHLQGASHPPPSEEEKTIQENLSSKVQGELCYISQFKTFPSYPE